jgi:chorismatase
MIECSFVEGAEETAPQGSLLGRVHYGSRAAGPELARDIPALCLPIDRAPGAGFIEQWHGAGAAQAGTRNGLVYAHDGETLFCAGAIPPAARYAAATRERYLEMFALLDALGYPHLFRIWNFIGGINDDNADGLEIYRDFCSGRAEAFDAARAGLQRMPAATGIGMAGAGAAFYLLACRTAQPLHIENTLQVPAWRYPRRYGPRPPSFARASALPAADGAAPMLFISGTASILGHETVHPGDAAAQCRVAINNIAHLVGADNLARQGAGMAYGLRDLDFIKVYYRHARDLPLLRAVCAEAFDARARIRYIETDICRADLLVEIEALVPATRAR